MLLQLLFTQPLIFLPLISALLVSLTVHEVAHGFAALWLGDSTAKDSGRLTFNPLIHIDPFGFLLLMTIGFGWGNPVPVNYYNLKYQKWGPAIVSVAGPLSNLLMIVFFGLLFKFLAPAGLNPLNLNAVILESGNLMLIFLAFLIFYNIILMIFNLIPVPPLDGSKVLFAALPDRFYELKAFLSSRGPLILFALLLIDNFTNLGIFDFIFSRVLGFFAQFF